MFLVQTTLPDGRDFYAFLTGYEARLTKNWISVPNSIPNHLSFQGIPTMSFNTATQPNFIMAKWTTAKVVMNKALTDTFIQLPNGKPGQVQMQPQWVRSVFITVQDNPFYTNTGFDHSYRPIIVVDNIRAQATAYRTNRATLIQLMPIQTDIPPTLNEWLAVIHISDDSLDESKDDSKNGSPSSAAKRPRGDTRGSGIA